MEEDLLKKCLFYKLEKGNVNVCVYADGAWEDSFVAIEINSDVFMLHGESNLHQGEKHNRKVISHLLTNDLTQILPLQKLSLTETSLTLKESIKDYFKNKYISSDTTHEVRKYRDSKECL